MPRSLTVHDRGGRNIYGTSGGGGGGGGLGGGADREMPAVIISTSRGGTCVNGSLWLE